MTVIREEEVTCGLCGKVSEHLIMRSAFVSGAPDLDTRPAVFGGHTDKLIQRCPSCGYCAPDVWKVRPGFAYTLRTMQSGSYQEQLHSRDFPEAANSFLCASLISENLGEYAGAGFECIRAAWICDDAHCDTAARECREKAVDLLRRAKEKRQRFARQRGGQEALLADLLRRSGEFDLARSFCKAGLKRKPEKTLSDVLRFEMVLIDRADAACHTVAEAQKA